MKAAAATEQMNHRQKSTRYKAATTLRRVIEQLELLEPATARHLAGLAFILTRVADADNLILPEETAAIETILNEYANLPEDQAVLAAEIARHRHRDADPATSYRVSRGFRTSATAELRSSMLRYVFLVAAADGNLSRQERSAIQQIASELGFTREEVIAAQTSHTPGHA